MKAQIVIVAAVVSLGTMAAIHRGVAQEMSAQDKAGHEKTATSGLGGAGPVVHGTPEDPLRDPRETRLN